MKLTKDMLLKMNACTPGFDWFNRQNETDVGKLIQLAIDNLDDDVFGFANWGIARLLDKTNKIRYAVFAAELVLPLFEEKYPDDDRPRKAIEAAKAVIIEENRRDVAAACAAARAAACAVARAVADAAAAARAAVARAVAYTTRAASAAAYAARAAAYAADAAVAYTYAYAAYIDDYAYDAAYAAPYAVCAVEGKKKEVQKQILEYGKSLLIGNK